MMRVDVHYFAAARAARGRTSEAVTADDGATIADLLAAILRAAGTGPDAGSDAGERPSVAAPDADRESLAGVLARCSFLVNAEAASGGEHKLAHGDRLDVLPPFAGG